jgi:hypothetical protein
MDVFAAAIGLVGFQLELLQERPDVVEPGGPEGILRKEVVVWWCERIMIMVAGI